MAGKDVIRRWQRWQRAVGDLDEDRLSDLCDDLLLDIMRRLDTRTALGAAALSSRWASLPRELPALDLKVTDILPPRYHRLHLLRHNARQSKISSTLLDRRRLNAIVGRYERHGMRAMVHSVKGLLASGAHRRVERLSLEVFAYSTSDCINHLVVDAVDSWGVRDLEVVVTNPGESRLRSLKLANCLPPPLKGFTALTTLVLRDLLNTTPAATYEGVVAACPQLQVRHLVSCEFTSSGWNPGESRLRSLKLANCLPPPLKGFTALTTLVLRDLPDTTPAATYEGVVAACPLLQVRHLVSCEFTSSGWY
ncbi:hypothetical protein ACQ4PT_044566 [Festuca glaucescens]